MKNAHLVLAVDGGGSSSKAVLYDLSGYIFKETLVGPLSCKSSTYEVVEASLTELHHFIKDHLDQMKSCVLALSGLDSEKDYERMIELLAKVGFFSEPQQPEKKSFALSIDSYWGFPIILCSDALLPLFANYFDAGSVVISGTGSIAINLSKSGEITRYGGWGYAVSDSGSGTWVGIQFLREALLACDRIVSANRKGKEPEDIDVKLVGAACSLLFEPEDPSNETTMAYEKALAIENWSIKNSDPKSYAALARGVIRLASSNENAICTRIIEDATDNLANLAYLSFDEVSPFVVLSGGLFCNEEFAYKVKDKIFKLSNGKATAIVNTKSPTFGAIRIVSFIECNFNQN